MMDHEDDPVYRLIDKELNAVNRLLLQIRSALKIEHPSLDAEELMILFAERLLTVDQEGWRLELFEVDGLQCYGLRTPAGGYAAVCDVGPGEAAYGIVLYDPADKSSGQWLFRPGPDVHLRAYINGVAAGLCRKSALQDMCDRVLA